MKCGRSGWWNEVSCLTVDGSTELKTRFCRTVPDPSEKYQAIQLATSVVPFGVGREGVLRVSPSGRPRAGILIQSIQMLSRNEVATAPSIYEQSRLLTTLLWDNRDKPRRTPKSTHRDIEPFTSVENQLQPLAMPTRTSNQKSTGPDPKQHRQATSTLSVPGLGTENPARAFRE